MKKGMERKKSGRTGKYARISGKAFGEAARKAGRLAACAAVLAALVFPGSILPVSAAGPGEDYLYTVRIYAGAKGTFKEGNPEVREITLPAGGRVSFEASDIVLPEGSRYYVKGIRRSGADALSAGYFRVEEDMDYVVAYGVKGNLVSYRISYVDEEGRELAPPEEEQGNVGDMPVVGHLPIEGYRPQAYNLTRTLRAEGDNAFTFRYTKIPEGTGQSGADRVREETETVTNTETVVVPREPDPEDPGTAASDNAQAAAAGPGESAAAGDDAAGDGAQPGAEEASPPGEPEELINLDEEETPLAGAVDLKPDSGAGTPAGMPAAAYTGIVSALVLVSAGLYFIIVKRRKKENEEKDR